MGFLKEVAFELSFEGWEGVNQWRKEKGPWEGPQMGRILTLARTLVCDQEGETGGVLGQMTLGFIPTHWLLLYLPGWFLVSSLSSSLEFLRAQPLVLSIYIHTFSDFLQSRGFQCHLYANNSQMYVF